MDRFRVILITQFYHKRIFTQVDIIIVQEDGHCKMCSRELSKGSEAVLDDGFIFCFKGDDGEDATCHKEFIEAESGFNNEKLL